MRGSGDQLNRQIKLCELLGLDANKTTHVTIEWEPHGVVTARWEGMKMLTEDEVTAVGELLSEDGYAGEGDP